MTQVDERPVDERPITTVPEVPDEPEVLDPGRGGSTRWWWPLAVGGAVLLLVGVVVGRVTAPDRSSDDERERPRTTTRTAADVVAPGALLGAIDGATRYTSADDDDVERYSYAWPGQILAAPGPSTGDAVAWQWETCDVPPAPTDEDPAEAPRPLDCTAVEGATDRRWESPPTSRTRLVRVIVTVDLGEVRVQAVTTPIAAVPWPADVTPGEPPPEASLTSPPPPAG